MANTETSVSNLKINRLTQTQLENASSLSNTEAYWVDPEFAGGKVLATDSNGDIVETTVAPADIGTVKSVNNTSPDSNGNVSLTIPTVNDATLTINQGGALKGTFTANASSNVTVNLDGNQRNIGEIIQSTIPLTDAGLRILDGGIINGSGIYADFVTYIAGLYNSGDYDDIFDTEANWQSSVTSYGVCGKFVYDSVNNTVRLPKYNSKIYTGDGEAQVKGNGIALGLTDGSQLSGVNSGTTAGFVAALNAYGKNVGTSQTSSNTAGYAWGITTDGSKSGIIADLSNITTSVDGYYYIVVATSTKTDIQVDIDEIATDLNGKVDKSACAEVYPVIQTYQSGTSWYRIYSDGWCEQGGRITPSATGSVTVLLLKTFADTNYSIQTHSLDGGTSSTGTPSNRGASAMASCGGSWTTSDITYTYLNSGWNYSWEARGYLAEGQYNV